MVFLGAVDVDIPADVRPCAPAGPERERREREAALLVGDALVAVRYFQTRSDEEPWRFAGFDSVAHGIELDTQGGHTFGATWAIDVQHVGLSFRREPLRPRWLSSHTAFRVDEPGGWEHVMGRRVDTVRLHWWAQKPPGEADGCHSVTLSAEGRTVHVVLGGDGWDGLEGQDENLAVVFDDAVAERAQLGPWNPGD